MRTGADYHVQYLLGAKRIHNISFDWVGIWNEAPWSSDYILTLRHSMTGIHLNDEAVPSGERICLSSGKTPLAAHRESGTAK